MSIPHIPQDLQSGVRVVVQTKYGPLRGGRTSNGAAVFLGTLDAKHYVKPELVHLTLVLLDLGHRGSVCIAACTFYRPTTAARGVPL